MDLAKWWTVAVGASVLSFVVWIVNSAGPVYTQLEAAQRGNGMVTLFFFGLGVVLLTVGLGMRSLHVRQVTKESEKQQAAALAAQEVSLHGKHSRELGAKSEKLSLSEDELRECHRLMMGLVQNLQIQGDEILSGEPDSSGDATDDVSQHEWAERVRAIVTHLDRKGLVKAKDIIRGPKSDTGTFRVPGG
jgi:hypothetical protein